MRKEQIHFTYVADKGPRLYEIITRDITVPFENADFNDKLYLF